mmetsp:Transcript_14934/g.18102  ORF Transcript_14934/g.18102 Transcript_14934/m.18102 type:complete len:87 (-) Transcript_14934:429-689(-)
MKEIESVMIEGGASILTAMLKPNLVDLVSNIIVTIAPTFIGGLNSIQELMPAQTDASGKVVPVKWNVQHMCQLGGDVVMCLSKGRE